MRASHGRVEEPQGGLAGRSRQQMVSELRPRRGNCGQAGCGRARKAHACRRPERRPSGACGFNGRKKVTEADKWPSHINYSTHF